MVASEQHLTVLPRKLATESIHAYLFCYCPLVGNLIKESLNFVFHYFRSGACDAEPAWHVGHNILGGTIQAIRLYCLW